MNIFKKVLSVICTIALSLSVTGCSQSDFSTDKKDSADINYVASFYPMYVLTKNLTNGIANVSVSCMADTNFGCINDYTMQPEDLKNIEKATAFIENGFDLEPFNDKIEKAYPDMIIIKSSEGIDIKKYGYNESEHKEDHDNKVHNDSEQNNNDLNPHIWTDINLYIEQVESVADQLKEVDPKNKNLYEINCENYLTKLDEIKTKVNFAKENLCDKKVIILDETLPDFCHSIGIQYIMIETDHEQQSLSAADMKSTIDIMKNENIKSILICKNSDDSAAKILSEETGAEIYRLNSCMTGKGNANEYINEMTENIDIINTIN